jgi:hypothetical protein
VPATIPVTARGPVTFTLEPTETAGARLARAGSLKVKIMLAYTPTGASAAQRRTSEVTLLNG